MTTVSWTVDLDKKRAQKLDNGWMCLKHNQKWNSTVNPRENDGLVPVDQI